MKKPDTRSRAHLRFAVLAADVALFTAHDDVLFVRLINVNRPPHFVHIPGLPGGLLMSHETAEEAALRHLRAKTGIAAKEVAMEQLYTFSDVERDPRGRVVAVTYLALVPWSVLTTLEREGAKASWWAPVSALPTLAYDHDQVLATALKRLRARLVSTTLIAKLLPHEFTLTELEELYECILGKPIDKRNFRKKVEKLKLLRPLEKYREGLRHRPARLYAFRSGEVKEIEIL